MALSRLQKDVMNLPNQDDEGAPKFGRLLVVLILAVLFCIALTWMMGALFPDFPNFN